MSYIVDMNRLLFLFAKKQKFNFNLSNFVSVSFCCVEDRVDCRVYNSPTKKQYFMADVPPKTLHQFFALPKFQEKLAKDFERELALHKQKTNALDNALLVAKATATQNAEAQNALILVLKTTASQQRCPILDDCFLELQTAKNLPAVTAEKLHFQICFDQTKTQKFANFASAPNFELCQKNPNWEIEKTLNFLEECLQKYPAEVAKNVNRALFLANIEATGRHAHYNKLKNKFLPPKTLECEK